MPWRKRASKKVAFQGVVRWERACVWYERFNQIPASNKCFII